MKVEYAHLAIVTETVGDLIAELIELLLALEEEAERHAWVELAHVYGSGWELAVVIRFLRGDIRLWVDLRAYVVGIKEDQPVCFVLFSLLYQPIQFVV